MAFGNPTAGGFETMDEALREVNELNHTLLDKYGVELAVSAHFWHEIKVVRDELASQFNNPRAIDINDWIRGVRNGDCAPVGRVIPPGFGIPGADNGAFINPDPERRKLAHDLMVLAFAKSEHVRSMGAGLGHVIYWTGPDGIRWQRLVNGDDPILSYERNPALEEWRMIVEGVSNAVIEARKLGCTGEALLIEGKPAGDPCYLDVFTDHVLEVRGIDDLNDKIGTDVAEWQGEFCHTRGSGMRFCDGLEYAIKSGVFGGRIHLNSGGLGMIGFSELLERGTHMSKFPQYVDNDFLPGQGPTEWLQDQQETLRVGIEWSAKTGLPFEIEFDARFCRYADTIGALRQSTEWVIEELAQYGAVPA